MNKQIEDFQKQFAWEESEDRQVAATAVAKAAKLDLADVKGRFCAHHASPGAVKPGCPECSRETTLQALSDLRGQYYGQDDRGNRVFGNEALTILETLIKSLL